MINDMNLNYKIEIRKLSDEDGGGYFATVPALPGCMGDGETPEEALSDIKIAINSWIETAKELGREIPSPDLLKIDEEYSGKLSLRLPKFLHKRIAEKAKEEDCSINQLIQTYIAMGLGNQSHIYVQHWFDENKLMDLMLKSWRDSRFTKFDLTNSNNFEEMGESRWPQRMQMLTF